MAPQQVGGPEPEHHPLLAIDGAGRLLEPIGLFQQPANDVTGGIVGVGHEVERFLQAQRVDEQDHLVQQGSLVAVGKHHAFVDAPGQRQGEYAGQRLGQHGDRLARVAEDVLRLGV